MAGDPGPPPLGVAAIGASAGGLKALIELFDALPPDSGLAFVVVQHLSPESPSLLPEILSRHTAMPVVEVEDGLRIAPNTVFVIPHNCDLLLRGGVLHLQKRERLDGLHLPIDLFFRSLAEDRGAAAVGIVLSGAGADGALGLRPIKERGGLIVVQDPATAEQASMPRSAIETGVADYILPPGDMPGVLLRYAAELREERPVPDLAGTGDANALQAILTILRARTGHDFAGYKQTTMLRRVQRRMLLRGIERLDEYARHLNHSPEEVQALFHEMLIGVTEFFRDSEAFDALTRVALPGLLDKRRPEDTLRVWVPACSTGEEAYSLAIVLREYLDAHGLRVPLQIFASDIDDWAIDKARRGWYPRTIAALVSPERLERFFVETEGDYVVSEAIRKTVLFAPQSVTKDPPFSRIDLVSCRNLLIYLEPELQRRVLAVLAYALKPGGYLFLGTSETPAELAPHFVGVDRKWRIYRRLEARVPLRGLPELPVPEAGRAGAQGAANSAAQPAIHHAVERLLLESYLPPSLVIDGEGEIRYAYGRVGRYLEPVAGQMGVWHVLRVLREGLRVPLIAALHLAAGESRTVQHKGIRLDLEGRTEAVDVTVTPLERPAALQGLFLVVLEEPRPRRARGRRAAEGEDTAPGDQRGREAELEKELAASREYLQAIIEELQSSNEEIQSTNEELQSANEELQTAQEEAESMNEELGTVNAQLEDRLNELRTINDDVNNALAGIDVGLVILDRSFHVRRFNRAATRVVNLIAGDVGRPIDHISSALRGTDWLASAHAVFDTLAPHQEEVRSEVGQWYLMRIQPYRTAENAIDGVVVTFTDITGQKQVEQDLRQTREFAEKVVDTVRQPLVVLDAELRVRQANRAFYGVFRLEPHETVGQRLYDLPAPAGSPGGGRQWDIPRLRELLEEVIPHNAVLDGFVVEHDLDGAGHRPMILNARRVDAGDGRPDLILLAFEEKEGPAGEAEARSDG